MKPWSRGALAVLALAAAGPARAEPPWQRLPPTPALPATQRMSVAQVNGISLFHAEYGAGSPVVLLHGGLANAAYWGLQIPALARDHLVVVLDSRGQGRSTRDSRPFGYALMAADVLALMDQLGLPRAALVGWSDGGIIGLQIAIAHPERVTALFAFAANADPSGVQPASGPAFAAYGGRVRREYQALSPTPDGFSALRTALARMWAAEPRFAPDQLRRLGVRTWIVGAEHDEVIPRAQTALLASLIPGSHLVILPAVSHFAFLQDPEAFNAALLSFLSPR